MFRWRAGGGFVDSSTEGIVLEAIYGQVFATRRDSQASPFIRQPPKEQRQQKALGCLAAIDR